MRLAGTCTPFWALGIFLLNQYIPYPPALKVAVGNNTEHNQLQENWGGTGKSCQNSSGTRIAKFAVAASLMTVQLTANKGVAQVKGVPQAKVMYPLNGGTRIGKFASATTPMTAQL